MKKIEIYLSDLKKKIHEMGNILREMFREETLYSVDSPVARILCEFRGLEKSFWVLMASYWFAEKWIQVWYKSIFGSFDEFLHPEFNSR